NTQISHIYGETTFNNFICTTAGKTLQFEAAKTQTIVGNLRFTGQLGNLIILRSTIDDTQWNIDPQGTRNVGYVDVKDSNNINAAEIRALLCLDSLNNTKWDWITVGLAEFVSIIDPDDGAGTDYTSLSSWEANNQADLTSTTTLVFSHAGITGTISDTDSVTGVTSGATADVVHASGTQILLENINGTFQSGEQVYQTLDTNYVTISNTGELAVSVASCRSSSGTADQTAVTIDGWTTSATNYIKIYTTQENRHSGIWSDSVYRLTGTAAANDTHLLDIKENHVKVEGLQISLTNSGGYTGCNALNMDSQGTASEISFNSNILKGAISETNSEGRGIYANDADITAKIYNNIIYDFVNGAAANTAGIATSTGGTYYLYNNSLIDNYVGIAINAGTAAAKNNIVKGSGDTNAYVGTFAAGTDYNATDGTDDIGQGSNNKTGQTFSFVNESIDNFHLDPADVSAKDLGMDLSGDSNISFSDDIDNETRSVAWDIGADEDDNPPLLIADAYTYATKQLVLTFDESVDASEITYASFELADSSSGGNSFTLTSSDAEAGTDGWTLTFTLTDTHRNTIASWDNAGTTTLYLGISAGGVKDLDGNAITVVSRQAVDTWTKDTIAPIVTDLNISITSSGSGAGGAYLVGETVIVQWDNSGSGDDNDDIVSVVCDFSALGGEATAVMTETADVYTASYTIAALISGTHTVAVTASDYAGNATTTPDTTDIVIIANLLSSTNVEPASLAAGVSGDVTVSFTPANPIPADGKVVVTFPTDLGAGFSFNSGGTTTAESDSLRMDGSLAVSVNSNVVTITRSAGTVWYNSEWVYR
ncbi:MAG: hypothetical protein KAI72_04370, partial [Candidatus Pacebacteria bacterium]|nr:hypothetical protein [Candidatus Paceibacterota bacterium]